MPHQKNIVLITIDCLRPDYLGCYGYKGKISPSIDKLSKNGVIFKNAFAHSSCTPLAFPSIFTATLPFSNGGPKFLGKDRISISEILNKHGYKTCAFQTNSWLSYHTNYVKGFEEYYEFYDLYKDLLDRLNNSIKTIKSRKINSKTKQREIINLFEEHFKFLKIGESSLRQDPELLKEIIREYEIFKSNPSAYILNYEKKNRQSKLDGLFRKFKTKLPFLTGLKNLKKPYADAETITNKAIEWIDNTNRNPFFLWIHYMDVHAPYLPGGSYRWPREMKIYLKLLDLPKISPKKADMQDIHSRKNLYAACVRYVDDQIKRLVSLLKNSEEETVVIITSDHGEELFEHGDNNHYGKLYDELIKVPLIFSGINYGLPTIDTSKLVGHVDIAPSILYLCGFNGEIGIGKNIFSSKNNEYLLAETLEDKNEFENNNPFQIEEIDIKKNYLVVGIRTKEKKLIYREAIGDYLYFDLNKDQFEKHPQNKKDSDYLFMKAIIDKRISEIKGQNTVYEYKKIDKNKEQIIMDQLRALGYIK